MSISSQQLSVQAACVLAGGGMTPKRSACQSSAAGVGVLSRSVITAFICLARRISGVIVIVAVVVLGEDIERRVEAEDVAVVIGAEQKSFVELLGLVLETFEALKLELFARRPLVLLIAMSARKSRTRAAVDAAELEEANAVDAISWPARLESRRANGLSTLVLCNVAPAETVVPHDLTFQRSW
eukprot:1980066-Pleurochrysis_carterae.AAC.1